MKMKVKVLFDVNVPRPLRDELPRHTVKTMQELGWDQMADKEVLMTRAAQEGFQVFVTKDKNIKHQVNLDKSKVILYEMPVPGSETRRSFEYLKSQMPKLREFLYELEFERRYERQQQIDEREQTTAQGASTHKKQVENQNAPEREREHELDWELEP